MKKLAFAVVIAASFLTACTATGMQAGGAGEKSTYVIDGYGNPVKSGNGCVTSNSPNSKSYPECEGGMAAQTPEPMVQPPKVITKVIVDCNRCNGNKPK